MRRRLQRLDRDAQTLADLLEVLLGLARGKLGAVARVETEPWLRQILGDIVEKHALNLHIDVDAQSLRLPPHEAALVIRDIARRLGRNSSADALEIRVCSGEITLRCAADASPESAPRAIHASGDRGLGATLSGRLATRIEWMVGESRLGSSEVGIRLPSAPG